MKNLFRKRWAVNSYGKTTDGGEQRITQMPFYTRAAAERAASRMNSMRQLLYPESDIYDRIEEL